MMEENENENEHEHENSGEFNSNIPVKTKTFSHADDQYHDSLLSTLITLYILILLYSPYHVTFNFIFSPVLFITSILLLTLLRLGATQKDETKGTNKQANCTTTTTEADHHQISNSNFHHEDHEWVTCSTDTTLFKPDPSFEDSFVEWNVRAPLEVIYEAYEGEEEDNKDPNNNEKDRSAFMIERYPSLSLCYPSDSDSSVEDDFLAIGNWVSPESVSFKWEDEDDREGLIEIALDGVHSNNNNNKRELDFDVGNFHGEEENNLIEIDIFSGE